MVLLSVFKPGDTTSNLHIALDRYKEKLMACKSSKLEQYATQIIIGILTTVDVRSSSLFLETTSSYATYMASVVQAVCFTLNYMQDLPTISGHNCCLWCHAPLVLILEAVLNHGHFKLYNLISGALCRLGEHWNL